MSSHIFVFEFSFGRSFSHNRNAEIQFHVKRFIINFTVNVKESDLYSVPPCITSSNCQLVCYFKKWTILSSILL